MKRILLVTVLLITAAFTAVSIGHQLAYFPVKSVESTAKDSACFQHDHSFLQLAGCSFLSKY